MMIIILTMIATIILGLCYVNKDELKQVWDKHSKKIIAFALASSMAAGGLIGVPGFELDIDDYLIDEISDYTDLGFDISKIEDLIIYQQEVLCEGHLPLAFKFSTLSKDVSVNEDFITISESMAKNMGEIDLTYKVLTNVSFTYEVPVYKTITSTQYDKVTENTTKIEYQVLDYYDKVSDYKYVWKDFDAKTIKENDVIVIDIIGNFEAGLGSKEVDIIPTLKLDSYSKTYDKYAWWNSNWNHKKEITINHSLVEATLTNFPICINITDSDLTAAQADGDDICFLNSAEDTQLNHEIELWNSSSGQLVAWVNVSSINAVSDVTIYMYYGNSGASNQENVEDVWDSDYLAVWHFNEASGNLIDSTSNDHDSESVGGTPAYKETGQIGYAIDFEEGDSDFFQIADSGAEHSLDGHDAMTIEVLAKHENLSTNNVILCVGDSWGVNDYSWYIDVYSTPIVYFTTCDGSERGGTGPSHNGAGVWEVMYFTTHEDEANKGVTEADSDTGADTTNPMVTNDGAYVGRRAKGYAAGAYGMDGLIDEVHISSVDRGDDWCVTTRSSWNNAWDGGFFTMGSEESLGSISIQNSVPDNTDTGVETKPRCNFTAVNALGTAMNVTWYDASYNVLQTNNSVANNTNVILPELSLAWGANTQYTFHINITDGSWWSNNSITFTTKSYYYNETIRADGVDYFTWMDNVSISAVSLKSKISGLNSASEYIQVWKSESWSTSDWLWQTYYGNDTGTNFTVDEFDVVRVYLADSGTVDIEMVRDGDDIIGRNVYLNDTTTNRGYNYTSYANVTTEYIGTIASNIGLDTGEVISWWDGSNYEWKGYIVGISPSAYNVTVSGRAVFETKVGTNEVWNIP